MRVKTLLERGDGNVLSINSLHYYSLWSRCVPKSLTAAESRDSWMRILSLPQWLYGGPLLRSLLSPPYLEMSSYILGWVWVPDHSLKLNIYSWMTLWSKKFNITESFSWKFELGKCSCSFQKGHQTSHWSLYHFASRRHFVAKSHASLCFYPVLIFFFLKPNLFPPQLNPVAWIWLFIVKICEMLSHGEFPCAVLPAFWLLM